MQGVRLPDGQMPENAGEYSWFDYSTWAEVPDWLEGDGEWIVKDPTGAFYALRCKNHSWTIDSEGRLTISPSIVAPGGGYHGFLRGGVWS